MEEEHLNLITPRGAGRVCEGYEQTKRLSIKFKKKVDGSVTVRSFLWKDDLIKDKNTAYKKGLYRRRKTD